MNKTTTAFIFFIFLQKLSASFENPVYPIICLHGKYFKIIVNTNDKYLHDRKSMYLPTSNKKFPVSLICHRSYIPQFIVHEYMRNRAQSDTYLQQLIAGNIMIPVCRNYNF